MTKQIYFGDWSNRIDMIADFEDIFLTGAEYEAKESPWKNDAWWRELKEKMDNVLASGRWDGVDVLFAAYEYEDYSGDAFVLFKKDGKLFEVHGGHCSCNGLEGQWEPEECTAASVRYRLDEGRAYGVFERYAQVIREAVDHA